MNDAQPTTESPPIFTVLLIGACIYIAIVTQLGKNTLANTLFYITLSPGLVEIRQGEVWRLISPILLHFGWVHLLFNLINFFVLGRIFEALKGNLAFLLVILVMGIASNLAQYLWQGPLFGGLSGVIYGLLGYFWFYGKFKPRAAVRLPSGMVWLMLIWFFLCWVGVIPNVANMAHTVGLLIGMAIGFVEAHWNDPRFDH